MSANLPKTENFSEGQIIEILVEKPIPIDDDFPPSVPIVLHPSFTKKHYQLIQNDWVEVEL